MQEKQEGSKRFGISTNIDFQFSGKLKIGLAIVLIVLIVIEFAAQMLKVTKPQTLLDTQTARLETVIQSYVTQATVIRDEVIIPGSSAGTVVPLYKNSSKVQKGQNVARVYSGETLAQNALKYNSVKKSLSYYEYFTNLSSSSFMASMTLYQQEITENLLAAQHSLALGQYEKMGEKTEELTKAIAKKQIAMGEQVDLSEKINGLKGLAEQLSASSSSGIAVAAPDTGFYVNECDGYEQSCKVEKPAQISPEQVLELLNSKKQESSGNVGKIVTQFNWYLVCNLKTEQLQSFYVGQKVKISVDELGGKTVTMQITAINRDEKNENAALVFTCNEISEELLGLRKTAVRIYGDQQTGFKIPQSAVRTVNGNVGVFVQAANVVKFKKIIIGYTDDNMILAVQGKGNQLSSYDEIIVKGTDLHDGAIVT